MTDEHNVQTDQQVDEEPKVQEPSEPIDEPTEPTESDGGFDWMSFYQPQVPPPAPTTEPATEPAGNDWEALVQNPSAYVKQVAEQTAQEVAARVAAQQAMAAQQNMGMAMALSKVQSKYGEKFEILRNLAAQRLTTRQSDYAPLASNPQALVNKLFEDAEKDAVNQAKFFYELSQKASGAQASMASDGIQAPKKPRANPQQPTPGDIPREAITAFQKAQQSGDVDALLDLTLTYPNIGEKIGV